MWASGKYCHPSSATRADIRACDGQRLPKLASFRKSPLGGYETNTVSQALMEDRNDERNMSG